MSVSQVKSLNDQDDIEFTSTINAIASVSISMASLMAIPFICNDSRGFLMISGILQKFEMVPVYLRIDSIASF